MSFHRYSETTFDVLYLEDFSSNISPDITDFYRASIFSGETFNKDLSTILCLARGRNFLR